MIHPADRYKSYFMHSKRTHFIQWLKVENIQFSEQGEPSCAHNSTWPSTRPIQKQTKILSRTVGNSCQKSSYRK